ncbi:hypothetical protein [Bradyrhizobium erythrophlei]|uniref:Uncharacterized protein n=1 Tax=Bradyrhizobium erythrophlei TaxID=1437360 RepID=A0A1M7UV04_9BRAD|nr:hypothetical protein [Bradyrhizobium erythrophlei]SHN86778.1 hypothetical protein SAMN05444170_6829 [Bradyrhizobium erythrophlei]
MTGNVVQFPSAKNRATPKERASKSAVEERFEEPIVRLPITLSLESAGDPIFAAIEAHRKACTIHTQRVEVSANMTLDDPGFEKANASTGEAGDEMFDRAQQLLDVRPSTRAGADALLYYASRPEEPNLGDDWRFPDFAENGKAFHLAMMKHVAYALCSIGANDKNVSGVDTKRHAAPDAELVALGDRYEALLDKYYQRRAAWSAKPLRSSVVVTKKMAMEMEVLDRAIRSLPATSIEGLRAKALPAFYDVAPVCHEDTEYNFEDSFAFQNLFQAVVNVVGLSDKVASTGYEMPERIWLQEEDEEA